jgi:hypothetical protein
VTDLALLEGVKTRRCSAVQALVWLLAGVTRVKPENAPAGFSL